MLLIRRIEIENFVCFDRIEIEPSTDPKRPLTLIRAENGSGKTTLLRAIRWGMYGEDGLPGKATQFSLHLADWRPDEDGMRTKVAILFETDGSSRDHPEGSRTNTAYELVRTVTTVARKPVRSGAPDFRRVDEHAQLMVQTSSGSWEPHEAGVASVVAQLLPGDLRDFFVMDADEAADFVGGSENKVVQRQTVIDKTSFAVRALLGLDVFKDATDRVRRIANEFGRSATKAVGDDELNRQQTELDRLRNEMKEAEDLVEKERRRKTEIEGKLESARDKLESLVGSIGAQDVLKQRLKDNRQRRERARQLRLDAFGKLSRQLSGIDLLATLASDEVSSVRELLQPLYDDGSIPSRHLAFVQGLLERGLCVCGQDLSAESDFRRHVQHLLDRSLGKEDVANYLAEVLQAANALHQFDGAEGWDRRCRELEQAIADLDQEIEDLDTDKREMDEQLNDVKAVEVQVTRDKIGMLATQKETIDRTLGASEDNRDRYRRQVNELDGQIRAQLRRQREARDHQACQQTSTILVDILEQAYATIRDEQVQELDTEMNRLFARMAANVNEEDIEDADRRKATLRMIDQVGMQRLSGDAGEFEIFALNSRGRSMPPTEINGASRRILALSFVLALCKVSRTYAPLVADSLLNSMSGSVRSNTLRVTAQTASQPILLLTPSDLESQNEVDQVTEFGGATYTLTGQWQHTDGDVVNLTNERRVALICSCGPRQFCSVCERTGQSGSPGWRNKAAGEGVR